MNIADDLPVDLDLVRLEPGQQRKPGIAGAKIINCQANTLGTQLFNGTVKLIKSQRSSRFR